MVVEVYAGLSAFKTALELAKGLKDIDDTNKRNAAVVELLEKILSAREQQAALLETVDDLKKKIAAFDAWDKEKTRYELKEIAPGGFAYILKEAESGGEELHKICVYCYEQRKRSVLLRGANEGNRAILRCYSCQAEVRLFVEDPKPAKAIPEDRVCPYCNGEMRLLSETNHPQLGVVGVKIHHLKCQDLACGKETTRDYSPKGSSKSRLY